jgi:ferrous iron transport protein B
MDDRTVKVPAEPPVILVGNPNVGKSALFNALSGGYVEVSNYPGTTVDYVSGWIKTEGVKRRIFDSPGADTLNPVTEDEMVTRDLILGHPDSPVICVVDSRNLKRGLVLISQLAEFGRRIIVALNMMDEAASSGIRIDHVGLSSILGVPVVPTVAIQRAGVEELRRVISSAAVPALRLDFGPVVENAVSRMTGILADAGASSRGLSLSFIGGDNGFPDMINQRLYSGSIDELNRIKNDITRQIAEPPGFYIAKLRNDGVREIISRTVIERKSVGSRFLNVLGELLHHPVYGIPALFLILVGMYYFVGVFGAQTLVGLIEENLFGALINPFFAALFQKIPSAFVRDLFVGDYGVITMALTYALALILPIVTTFFLAFGVLEDSGYLPRLAFMVDRLFKKIGLNGRAVLPMILGLGCDTMAVLTTRILSTKKEKILVTFLLALAIPCSAQLGITLGILGSISFLAVLIWLFVVVAVLFFVGYISSKVVPGRSSDFILEIPPLRLPTLRNIAVKTLMRLEWYLREAVPLFVLGTLILFVLDKVNILGALQSLFSPVVTGILGLPERSSEALIMGFLRRDYGAAGFRMLFDRGMLDQTGALVAMTTITLFIPCIANFFIIIKERGIKMALGMTAFIIPFAILVGGLLNLILRSVAIW